MTFAKITKGAKIQCNRLDIEVVDQSKYGATLRISFLKDGKEMFHFDDKVLCTGDSLSIGDITFDVEFKE